jgi:L-amino acid N-acyltransferase YncA
LTFQTEQWITAEPEIRELVQPHWEELAMDKDKIPLDINWDHYRECDQRGILQLTTARTSVGNLAGYWITIINQHPHYQSTVFGLQDSYFLHPSHRHGNVGMGLMLAAVENCKKAGAKSMIGSHKEHVNIGGLFEFCGWKKVGSLYQKWVGE